MIPKKVVFLYSAIFANVDDIKVHWQTVELQAHIKTLLADSTDNSILGRLLLFFINIRKFQSKRNTFMIEYSEKEKKLIGYTFIDLFCGIGGFHLALSSLGAKCVFASEINKKACEIYEKNFKLKPSGDITKIKCKDIPSHDILCAGFPCQPFSISGNKKGFKDKNGK